MSQSSEDVTGHEFGSRGRGVTVSLSLVQKLSVVTSKYWFPRVSTSGLLLGFPPCAQFPEGVLCPELPIFRLRRSTFVRLTFMEKAVSVRGAGTSLGGRLPRASEHGFSAAICILVWCVQSLLGVDAVSGCAGKCLRSNRTTFYIVGMVPFSGFESSYGPALKDYLNNEVGTKYEPRITFDIREARKQVAQTCAAAPAGPPTRTRRDAHVHRRTLQRSYIGLRLRTQDGEEVRETETEREEVRETETERPTHTTPHHTHTHNARTHA